MGQLVESGGGLEIVHWTMKVVGRIMFLVMDIILHCLDNLKACHQGVTTTALSLQPHHTGVVTRSQGQAHHLTTDRDRSDWHATVKSKAR